jgi:hypothetical protein
MTWATIADVARYTGTTTTDAQITQAQAIVELFADVTEEASTANLVSSKNLRLLSMAVSYQAAWMALTPDVFTHQDAQSVQQDSVAFTPAHANAALLAPLAKRCIDRLSWKRIRGLRIGAAGSDRRVPARMNATNAVLDDNDPRWVPLGDASC